MTETRPTVTPGAFALLLLFVALSASVLPRTAAAQAPVEYVRVCEVFGSGFLYIPGTEFCGDASLMPYRVQTAFGTAATNVGGPSPTRNSVYGTGAFGVGRNTVAIGNGAWSGGDPLSDSPGSVRAPGFGDRFPRSAFFNDNTTAVGQGAQAGIGAAGQNNATAIGQGSRANALDATAIGQGAVAGGAGSTALGRGAQATFAAATAIGAGAVATRANQIVLGTAAESVQAPGIASAASRAAQTGPLQVVTSDAQGNLATASIDVVGSGQRLDRLDATVSSLAGYAVESRKEARQGIAAAMAMVPAPMPSAPGVTSWTLNTATFESEWAGSAAVSHRLDSETPFSLNAAYSYGGGGSHGFRFGVASEF